MRSPCPLGRTCRAALADCPVGLPSYLDGIALARRALGDDEEMHWLDGSDRATLRQAFDAWEGELRSLEVDTMVLHGEPHLGNVLQTADGLLLIDFESACVGPMEWDLASTVEGVVDCIASVDPTLLRLCRNMNSARVATWAWAGADQPAMRLHAEHHLGLVRAALAT